MSGSPTSHGAHRRVDVALADEAATRLLGEDIAVILRAGDVLALCGPLGIGKSTFARALIRAVADDAHLDVPSPTFTLVQTYDLRLPVAHFDLYRVADPAELTELGFDQAVAEGVVLIEWPERAGDMLPRDGVRVTFNEAASPDGRHVVLEGPTHIVERIERSLSIRRFLDTAGLGGAARRYLLGDASYRAYERLETGDRLPPILMDAPARSGGPVMRDGKTYSQLVHLADDVVPFVAVARWLRAQGLAAPAVLHADLDQGILIVENLGGQRLLTARGEPVEDRYEEAILCLAAIHRRAVPDIMPAASGRMHRIARFDRRAMLIEVEVLIDWYMEFSRGRAAEADERQRYLTGWNETLDMLEGDAEGLVLRDYHSPNLFWRPEEKGLKKIGIIDFQDAMVGPPAYDVASLVRDARVTIPFDMAERLVDAYVRARGADEDFNETRFRAALAIMGAQRNSKILGLFVRLDRRDGKPAYLKHLPRIRSYLEADLRHDSLKRLRSCYEAMGLLDHNRAK